jgi:hypothetical protein
VNREDYGERIPGRQRWTVIPGGVIDRLAIWMRPVGSHQKAVDPPSGPECVVNPGKREPRAVVSNASWKVVRIPAYASGYERCPSSGNEIRSQIGKVAGNPTVSLFDENLRVEYDSSHSQTALLA